ncbi:MAG: sugar phosphate isomerase/epimerase family protein [Chloroflexota bacterium]
MTYNLACADFTFPLLPHDDVLRLISMLDLQGVDIGLFEERSHLWPSREFDNLATSARGLRAKLNDLGLVVADLFLQMDPDFEPYAINHPDENRRQKAREWFLQTLEYANECGCHHVTGLPGVHFEEEHYEDSLLRTIDELSWRIEQATDQNVIFGVEAHVGSIVPTPDQTLELLRRTPGLTLTLDYTHFTRAGLPDSAVEPLVAHASHFHVRGARKDRLQERFAHNIIDYKQVLRAMQKSGYAGWLGIEYVWIDWEHCNECDNLSETILFRDFLREQMLLYSDST